MKLTCKIKNKRTLIYHENKKNIQDMVNGLIISVAKNIKYKKIKL